MTNNEEIIEVEYNRSGVPLPDENNLYGFSKKISNYLYPKIYSIPNEDETGGVEFDDNEIQNHHIVLNGEMIDISTTRKLLIYLKGLVRKSTNRINVELNRVSNKVDVNETKIHEIDSELNSFEESISSRFDNINEVLNEKSNLNHTHNIEDVSSLNSKLSSMTTSINSKANSSDLSNHISNKKNPHGVTLTQLGFEDSGWKNIELTSNFYLKSGYKFQYRTMGKIVHIRGGIFAKKDIGSKYNILGYIPKEVSPNFEEVVAIQGELNKYSLSFVVRTDGTLGLMNKSESSNLNILQNTWLPVYITYFLG